MTGTSMHLILTGPKGSPWVENTCSDDLGSHVSLEERKQELSNRAKVDKYTDFSPEPKKRLLKVEFMPRFLTSDEDLVLVLEGFCKKGTFGDRISKSGRLNQMRFVTVFLSEYIDRSTLRGGS
jgi:hypothetical protein